MKNLRIAILFALIGLSNLILSTPARLRAQSSNDCFVQVSQTNPRYFEYSDGTPYIPVGVNLCILRDTDANGQVVLLEDEAALKKLEFYFQQLSKNGGNYARIWLGMPPFDIETQKQGNFDPKRIENVQIMLDLAQKYNIRLKLCFEHFRTLEPRTSYAFGVVGFGKPLYKTNPPETIEKFMSGETGQRYYLTRCAEYAKRFKGSPYVFAWELWNEVNCVPDGLNWTKRMLPQVHALFPQRLVVESLGSFDGPWAQTVYDQMAAIPDNDFIQVHRYLDPGTKWDVCSGPMDVLAADCVAVMRNEKVVKPIIATELGAVEAHHAGPSKLYELDKQGILFHDILFAPFFAGAAGSGHCWHWNVYLERNDLWYHIGRFSRAIAGVNPITERFEPSFERQEEVRVYGLRGKTTTLIWVRDSVFDWKKELIENQPAIERKNLTVKWPGLKTEGGKGKAKTTVSVYDPWSDQMETLPADCVSESSVVLPRFCRSAVIRIQNE